MTNRAVVELHHVDFDGGELHAMLTALTGLEPDACCNAVGVMVLHDQDGGHTLAVVSDGQRNARQIAQLLTHTAAHVYGGCRRCARRNARRGRHATA